MPEWPNGIDSKSIVAVMPPRVRIPVSPPFIPFKPAPVAGLSFLVDASPYFGPYFCSGKAISHFSHGVPVSGSPPSAKAVAGAPFSVPIGVPVCPAELSGQVTSYAKSKLGRGQLPIAPPFSITMLLFAPMYFVLRSSAQLRTLQTPHHLPRPYRTRLLQYGLTIVFRFYAAPCAQKSAQFAQFVVRSSEGTAQMVRGAGGRPRRDGSFGSCGALFHLPWQERSITPLACCRHRRGVCGRWWHVVWQDAVELGAESPLSELRTVMVYRTVSGKPRPCRCREPLGEHSTWPGNAAA